MNTAFEGLPFGRGELQAAMLATYRELIAFVTSPSFAAAHDEMIALDPADRPEFVRAVFLNPDELERRKIRVPNGVLIQRSAFGDRRPTLFAVKKFLPREFHGVWENVNLTFDNEGPDQSADPELAWRSPLPVALQDSLISEGRNLTEVPDSYGVQNARWFQRKESLVAGN